MIDDATLERLAAERGYTLVAAREVTRDELLAENWSAIKVMLRICEDRVFAGARLTIRHSRYLNPNADVRELERAWFHRVVDLVIDSATVVREQVEEEAAE